MEFWSSLAAIVVIDLVLSGDNAVLIALAARNLPKAVQRRAIVWGTLGAVGARGALTVAMLWVLQVPGLMLGGGIVLVWIAYRLLTGEARESSSEVAAAAGFWTAMRTIVVADLVMGLENVLGVAGAAQGSVMLVILGLLISIPIVVWGSTVVLKWLERWPALLYLGGAALAWTAAGMIASEPFVEAVLDDRPAFTALVYLALIAGVLAASLLKLRGRTPI